MTILKNISVKTGTWTDREGKERGSYVVIGHMHEGQHGPYITLESHMNLAAFPRKPGDSRVVANMFDPKPRDDKPKAEGPAQSAPSFDDDIPF